MRKSKEFWDAAVSGNIELMRTLSLDPEVDINWKDASGHTAFHQACVEGNEEVVRYLLDFNQKAVDYNSGLGSTPLLSACFYGHNRVFEMLVGDERIDLNKGNPLCMSSMHGNLEAVKFLLASGRQIDTTKRDQIRNMTAAELARKSGRIQIAELLEAYEKDPLETRERLRKELGYSENSSSEFFVLLVYLSDDYLGISEQRKDLNANGHRWVSMAKQLPIELQMILCNRAFGLSKDLISSSSSEPKFLKWGKVLSTESAGQ